MSSASRLRVGSQPINRFICAWTGCDEPAFLYRSDWRGGENLSLNVVAAHLVAAIASFERHLNHDRGDGDFGASSSPSSGSPNNHWALSVS